MTAPSLLHAARTARDRRERILRMAETMRERIYGLSEGCTVEDLQAAGFTEAEAYAYRDDAIGALSGRPSPLRTIPIGRLKGLALARRAEAIRHRNQGRGARA
ncbi:hypothetical protein [Methylobacterium sp. V23]|uniref:hypothetical protein n=1 Tax=Methylobacterium sp. V23 TaxID=2044878 RepID=UPI000CDB932E|nr:hypothetical protein [Methylobacterium sp. V23]POR42522.1 hypothetical protein CRT23_12070 [Methylobacterium sp. V23]